MTDAPKPQPPRYARRALARYIQKAQKRKSRRQPIPHEEGTRAIRRERVRLATWAASKPHRAAIARRKVRDRYFQKRRARKLR